MGMGAIVWPKNRMISRRVSLVDRERFLLPGHKDWRGLGGNAEHARRRKGPDVLELALEGEVGPQEGAGRRGVEERHPVITLHAALCRTSK